MGAPCRRLDALDLAVEAFAHCVGDRMPPPGHDVGEPFLEVAREAEPEVFMTLSLRHLKRSRELFIFRFRTKGQSILPCCERRAVKVQGRPVS